MGSTDPSGSALRKYSRKAGCQCTQLDSGWSVPGHQEFLSPTSGPEASGRPYPKGLGPWSPQWYSVSPNVSRPVGPLLLLKIHGGFPGGTLVPPASTGDARDVGSIPGLGRSSGVGNGNPLQSSCLQNPMDRGAWWAIVHGVAKSRTQLTD